MDRFKINGAKLVDFYNTDTTLGQVFSDIESDLKKSNQVVCQYIVNGKELGEVDETQYFKMKLSQVDTLEYLSENVNELVIDVLQGWVDSFPELMNHTEMISKQIRFSGVQSAFGKIQVLIENYEFLISSVISIKNLLGDSAAAGLAELSNAEDKTKAMLEEALTAVEKKDFVCLADIIEYELVTSLQLWEKLLTNLLGLLNGEKSVDKHSGNNGYKIISSFTPRGRMAN